MDFKQIQSIIKDFENSNITHLEIEFDNFKIKLEKDNVPKAVYVKEESEVKPNEVKEKETTGFQVKSPLVGTFYAASSPQEEPFVKVGQHVNKGDTLCIIEAMKIMNEITSPVSGVIEAIHVNNGEAVGFDEVIMTIV
ncbi:MAG: acetyl-CoA carboxylase, biotin carboxyl carrier protein [Bacilli bacterium]|nr:acetyl-CoA carboxylase, biotin carboxyl carrier protein [Bacilli bacterium]